MVLLHILWLKLPALIVAHEGAGFPKIVGGRLFPAELRNRNIFTTSDLNNERNVNSDHASRLHIKRANCGPGVGSCAANECCSSGGVCGTGTGFCAGPDCQFSYGPACDANTIPIGASTAGIARTKVGSVSYGTRINSCVQDNVFSLTFDDGPFSYTSALLDLLDQYNAKATFFITGNNNGKRPIDDCSTSYPAIIKRIYNSGHQIASHTWTHQKLNTLSATDFSNQVIYNEMALRNILGVIPTYFRPPYVDCNAACFADLANLGYHVIYYDLDTFDYANNSPATIQNSKNYFSNYINPMPDSGLVLSHDIHYQTVYNLTKFMLDTMASKGYGTSVTVGTCLGDPPANWYRQAGSTKNCGTPPPLVISTAGNCTGGITCQGSTFGSCCSRYNFCGSTSEYCGEGCQPGFGSCGTQFSSTAGPSTTSRVSLSSSVTSSSPPFTTAIQPTRTTTTTGSFPSLTISQNGKCGVGVTCQGSVYGNCCSRYGNCGGSADHCGAYCQPSYGSCTAPNPSATPRVSTDGSCGSGITCKGSTFGTCCSRYNFCGSDTAYCGTGCQTAYGICT